MMCSVLSLAVRVILILALIVLCLTIIKGLLRLHLLLADFALPVCYGRMSTFLLMMVLNTPQTVEIGLPRFQLAIIVFGLRILTKEHYGHVWPPFDLIVDLILLFNRFVNVIEDLIID